MNLNDFNFHLPHELIAQEPLPRGEAKLLHVDSNGRFNDLQFNNILSLLQPNDVIIFNDTKVIPALLKGYKYNNIIDSMISIDITLVKNKGDSIWQILAKPAKKLKLGDVIYFSLIDSELLNATVVSKNILTNEILIKFNKIHEEFWEAIFTIGQVPLPSYIKRHPIKNDAANYQTVFASKYGAIAAPTAGLHFTHNMINAIKQKGVYVTFITLHVGMGTFMPVKTTNIDEHVMHAEYFELSQDSCNIINNAKRSNARVISVGTTVARTLESCSINGTLSPRSGETNIFIKPGYKFQLIDALITNFHLPKSTLFMLVCALAGYDTMHKAYAHAIYSNYRFFSYGDACFLEKASA